MISWSSGTPGRYRAGPPVGWARGTHAHHPWPRGPGIRTQSGPGPPRGCRVSLYAALRDMPVLVEDVTLERLELQVSPEFSRVTTVVRLEGAGHAGLGEDVTYEADDAMAFQAAGPPDLRGEWTIHSLSTAIGDMALSPTAPAGEASREYRRWAVESAALDLALRQAGEPLWRHLGIDPQPVTFVISTGLGEPPDPGRVLGWADAAPGIGVKVDATPSWTREVARALADGARIDTVDLKGHYPGKPVDPGADPALYAMVAEEFPDAWLEDPRVDDRTRIALAGADDRISWDAPIHDVADLEAMPIRARAVNVKPSRLGSLERLFALYDHIREHDLGAYGGGQYEIGPGRGQIQYLASLFHPEAPNDTSPVDFHLPPRTGLPTSPLAPAPTATGFRWHPAGAGRPQG